MTRRLFFLTIFTLVLTAAVIVRLFALQVLSHSVYRELAENQHGLFQTLVPIRGEVFIHEGKTGKTVPISVNIEKDLVFAVPPEIADKQKTAAALARVLELEKADILESILDDSRKWVPLKKQLPESVSAEIRSLKLVGIYLQPETHRFYPEDELAAQVLGFLGARDEKRLGQYGVEEKFEETLAGKGGSLRLEKDIRGRWITGGVRKLEEAEDGADLLLTIDRGVQYKAESVIKSTVTTFQADSGSIVIIEPATGKVLAMANYPTFDPNLFNKVEDPAVFRNPIVSEAYEPGSVFKPFTMAAGLDTEAIAPEETFEDKGFVKLADFTIKNANDKTFGVQTMTQVLEQSINTGAIYIQQKTGREKFHEIVRRFGFGEDTGITLPAESPGDIRNLKTGGDIHYATASYGQGITVTALQLAVAYAAIANQGKLMKPYIVEKIIYSDSREESFGASETRQVISARAANTTGAMLVSVVENGHGKRAGVPGYYIAGKTGTAQVARTDAPGYDPENTIGTFAGFGPVGNPAFAMVVKINNPKTVRFAESTAAPAFGEMARFLVNYLQIPPTR